MFSSDSLSQLVSLLGSTGDQALQQACACALTFLAEDAPETKHALVQTGCLSTLATLVGSASLDVATAAASAIGQITHGHAGSQAAAVECGCMAALLERVDERDRRLSSTATQVSANVRETM